jgi:DNA-binding transcriptional LysR family regulator
MDFDQLQSFLEVARHASFSRAAEKRFRTQPAISSQIRALEDEVGAKLFDRSGGRVCLTAAGKVFEKYVQEALDARKSMLSHAVQLPWVQMKARVCIFFPRFSPNSRSVIPTFR